MLATEITRDLALNVGHRFHRFVPFKRSDRVIMPVAGN